jgi:excisionase family DNA binding protein
MSLEHNPARQRKRRAPPCRVAVTVTEFADATRLSRATIYRLMRAGDLRFVQFGRVRRIPFSEYRRLGLSGAD